MTVAHPLRGRTAVVGIGNAGTGEAPGRSAIELLAEASLAAIEDAGLTLPIVLFLMSERMRNLGSYTFADAAAFRLDRTPIRLVAATGSLVVVLLYLVAQAFGAGKVVELLFGINYWLALAGVGALMILYVTVGGMQATTWVQITKAALLSCGGTLLALAVLWHFDLSFGELFAAATKIHPKGTAILAPGGLFAEPVSAISLGLALVFGTAGLPRILMRFFTVKDAAGARKRRYPACRGGDHPRICATSTIHSGDE